jgi:hypothetical protein
MADMKDELFVKARKSTGDSFSLLASIYPYLA